MKPDNILLSNPESKNFKVLIIDYQLAHSFDKNTVGIFKGNRKYAAIR